MSGSNANVNADDLLEFATGRASDEVRERVLRAMNDENHPLSCLVRFRSQQVAKEGLTSKSEEDESPSADVDRDNVDDIVAESLRSEIGAYLEWEQSQIDEELSDFLPEQEAEIVRRSSGQVSPLKPYLDEIRRVVCQEWGWCNRRDDGALNEPVNLVIALADAFVTCRSQIPFPPTLLAVSIVKIGLERLCRERKA
jgi:hypothetical protein